MTAVCRGRVSPRQHFIQCANPPQAFSSLGPRHRLHPPGRRGRLVGSASGGHGGLPSLGEWVQGGCHKLKWFPAGAEPKPNQIRFCSNVRIRPTKSAQVCTVATRAPHGERSLALVPRAFRRRFANVHRYNVRPEWPGQFAAAASATGAPELPPPPPPCDTAAGRRRLLADCPFHSASTPPFRITHAEPPSQLLFLWNKRCRNSCIHLRMG